MKKFVAFAMILGLGLFCAVGCRKPVVHKVACRPDRPEAKHGTTAPAMPGAPPREAGREEVKSSRQKLPAWRLAWDGAVDGFCQGEGLPA